MGQLIDAEKHEFVVFSKKNRSTLFRPPKIHCKVIFDREYEGETEKRHGIF